MGISSGNQEGGRSEGGALSSGISTIAWGKATIGIAAVMLIPDSADAQTVSTGDDLPQVRVTAPKRQAAKRQARRAPARPAPAVATGSKRCDGQSRRRRWSRRRGLPHAGSSRLIALSNAAPEYAADRQRRISAVDAGSANDVGARRRCAMCRESPSPPVRAACRAIKSTFADTARETTFTEMAFAIRAGTRATHSAIDRVEVYKGPSSFLFGRGSTGGVINIVSKLPQNRDFYVVEGNGQLGARRPRDDRLQQDVRRYYGAPCHGWLRHGCGGSRFRAHQALWLRAVGVVADQRSDQEYAGLCLSER